MVCAVARPTVVPPSDSVESSTSSLAASQSQGPARYWHQAKIFSRKQKIFETTRQLQTFRPTSLVLCVFLWNFFVSFLFFAHKYKQTDTHSCRELDTSITVSAVHRSADVGEWGVAGAGAGAGHRPPPGMKGGPHYEYQHQVGARLHQASLIFTT